MLVGIGIFGFTGGPAYAASADVQMHFEGNWVKAPGDGGYLFGGGTFEVSNMSTEAWAAVGIATDHQLLGGTPWWQITQASVGPTASGSSSNAYGGTSANPLYVQSIATGTSGTVDSKITIKGDITVIALDPAWNDTVYMSAKYWGPMALSAGAGETAYGWSKISVGMVNSLNPQDDANKSATFPVAMNGAGQNVPPVFPTDLTQGTIVTSMNAYVGETIHFTATLEAKDHTTVPIPGAMWLLGSGLVGLVGIRRRFQK